MSLLNNRNSAGSHGGESAHTPPSNSPRLARKETIGTFRSTKHSDSPPLSMSQSLRHLSPQRLGTQPRLLTVDSLGTAFADLAATCWSIEPSRRPAFHSLVNDLTALVSFPYAQVDEAQAAVPEYAYQSRTEIKPVKSWSCKSPPLSVCLLGAQVWSGHTDGSVCVWTHEGELLVTLPAHKPVSAVSVIVVPNCTMGGPSPIQTVWSAGGDGRVHSYDPSAAAPGSVQSTQGRHVCTAAISRVALTCMHLHSYSASVMVGDASGNVHIVSGKYRTVLQVIRMPGIVSAITSNILSVFIASGREIFDFQLKNSDGQWVQVLAAPVHESKVIALACSDTELWTGSEDGLVRIWNASAGRPDSTTLLHEGRAKGLLTMQRLEARRLMLLGMVSCVNAHSIENYSLERAVVLPAETSGAGSIATSAGGLLCFGCPGSQISLWQVFATRPLSVHMPSLGP